MGKRNRQRGRLKAPNAQYTDDATGAVLELRGSMSPATRREYHGVLHDQAASTEDSWHRSVEFLFERLAVTWTISEVPTSGQKELLMRFRMASQDERAFVRRALREHLGEHFPDLEAP